MPPVLDGIAGVEPAIQSAVEQSRIHSRRFREYCDQVIDKQVDELANHILNELNRFYNRQVQKNPTKAKSKRRFVLGIREVFKHLKLGKIKCVIVSPNLEKIQSKGNFKEHSIPIESLQNKNSMDRLSGSQIDRLLLFPV